MGSFKTPQEKKRLSLANDRRNTYGQNDKASRKAIRRNKQIGQGQLRRAINQALQPLSGVPVVEEVVEDSAARVSASHGLKDKRRFKKAPDSPLGEVVKRQLARRTTSYRARIKRREARMRRPNG